MNRPAPTAALPRLTTLELFPALDLTDRVVTLEQLLASTKHALLPLEQALHLGAALAQRVAAIHSAGRAVGLLDAERVRISASGQVSLTRTGGGALAPELRQGGSGTMASDVYAVGFLIHHLVTGQAPRADQPVPPSQLNPRLDAELDAVLLATLRPAPEERPAAVLALQAALEGLGEERGLTADARGVGQQVERLLEVTPAARQTLPPLPAAEAWLADPGPLLSEDAVLDSGRPVWGGLSPRLLLGAAALAVSALLFTALAVLRPAAEPRPPPPASPVVEARASRAEPPPQVLVKTLASAATQAPSTAAAVQGMNEPAPQGVTRPTKRVKVRRSR